MNIPDEIKQMLDINPNIGRHKLSKIANIDIESARFYCHEYKKLKQDNNDFSRIIAGWDLHYPYHSKQCFNILKQAFKQYKPDVFIIGGDWLDMDMISSYDRHKPKLVEGKRLKLHYKNFQKDILTPIDNILSKDCERHFIIGNHEYRIERYIEEYPQHEGFIELENNLNLDKWNVIPFNDNLKLGELIFIHGLYTNKYHAAKTLSVFDENVFYGHVHESQRFSKTTPVNNNPKAAQAVGCLCNKNPAYLRNRPNNWEHQFLVVDMFNSGEFIPHVVGIIDGRCTFNGNVLQG